MHNYCFTDTTGKTLPMMLGFAKVPVALEDILYFSG
jgi:hypothetical protein